MSPRAAGRARCGGPVGGGGRDLGASHPLEGPSRGVALRANGLPVRNPSWAGFGLAYWPEFGVGRDRMPSEGISAWECEPWGGTPRG